MACKDLAFFHLRRRRCSNALFCAAFITTCVGLTFQGLERLRVQKAFVQKGRQNRRDKTPVPSAICGDRAGVAQLKNQCCPRNSVWSLNTDSMLKKITVIFQFL